MYSSRYSNFKLSILTLLLLAISFLGCSKNPAPAPEPEHYKLVFESYRNGYNNIFIMNEDGTEQANLTTSTVDERQPEWSYKGNKILYQSTYDVLGTTFLGTYMMNPDGTNKSKQTPPGLHAAQASNPPNTEMILYHAKLQRATEGDIYVINFLYTYQMQLTNNNGNDHSPIANPVHDAIAFISNKDGNSEIYVMEGDGSNQTNLSLNPGSDADHDWSPDGSKLAWTSERGGNMDIYSVTVESNFVETRLTDYPGTDMDPNWSPDGTKIAFISTRGGSGVPNIFVMGSDGSNVKQLTEGSFNLSPQWSPDGRLIAFTSMRDGNTEIYVMNSDGSNQTRLTFNPGVDGHPRWCPIPIDEM